VEVDPVDGQVFLQRDVDDGSQDGAVERADAADEGHEKRVEGPGRAEGVRRVVADVVVGEEAARESRQRRREHEREKLEPERTHSGSLRGVLVFADRPHAEPGPRGPEQPRRDDGKRCQGQRKIVAMGESIAPDDARRERGDLGQDIGDRRAEDLAQRERADGEIGAAEPEGGGSNREREECGHGRARRHREENRRPRDPQCARHERADAEEGGVPQVDLPDVAGQDVPARRQRDREQDEKDEVEDIVALRGLRQKGQRS